MIKRWVVNTRCLRLGINYPEPVSGPAAVYGFAEGRRRRSRSASRDRCFTGSSDGAVAVTFDPSNVTNEVHAGRTPLGGTKRPPIGSRPYRRAPSSFARSCASDHGGAHV